MLLMFPILLLNIERRKKKLVPLFPNSCHHIEAAAATKCLKVVNRA